MARYPTSRADRIAQDIARQKNAEFLAKQSTFPVEQPMATDREALTMALACIRWLAFGERRIPEWSGSPPKTSDTLQALRAALASAPAIEPVSPMAKMAQALRDKAAAEKASFDTRVQSGEWGPAPDAGTEADCQLEHVAQVEGDAVVRTLRWNKNVGAFEYPVGTKLYAASAPLASAPAAPPVEQQAATMCAFHSVPWTGCAWCTRIARRETPPAPTEQPAPQAGAVEPALRPDIQAVLLELDVPVQGYLASHAGTFLKHAAMMPPEEYPIPLVRESDHRRACRKIAALATHPTEQPSQDAKNARRWRWALVESPEWTYAVCKWDGCDWLPIKTEADISELDAARAAQAQGEKGKV